MRPAVACVKCGSAAVVRVPAVKGGSGAGNFILFGLWTSKRVPVTRYVCSACGFCEEWIDDSADVARVVEKFGVNWPPRPA